MSLTRPPGLVSKENSFVSGNPLASAKSQRSAVGAPPGGKGAAAPPPSAPPSNAASSAKPAAGGGALSGLFGGGKKPPPLKGATPSQASGGAAAFSSVSNPLARASERKLLSTLGSGASARALGMPLEVPGGVTPAGALAAPNFCVLCVCAGRAHGPSFSSPTLFFATQALTTASTTP